jgi:hypothetical protein
LRANWKWHFVGPWWNLGLGMVLLSLACNATSKVMPNSKIRTLGESLLLFAAAATDRGVLCWWSLVGPRLIEFVPCVEIQLNFQHSCLSMYVVPSFLHLYFDHQYLHQILLKPATSSVYELLIHWIDDGKWRLQEYTRNRSSKTVLTITKWICEDSCHLKILPLIQCMKRL